MNKTKLIIVIIILAIIFLATGIYTQLNSQVEDNTQPQQEVTVIEKKETKQTNFTHIEKEFEYYKVMTRYGWSVEEIEYIKNECKEIKQMEGGDYHRCLAITTSISWIEGNNGQNKNGVGYSRNNLFSFRFRWYEGEVKRSDFKYYPSRMESIKDFFRLYKTKWYKNNCEEMLTKSKYTHEIERIGNCYKMYNKFEYIQ